MKIAIIGAGIIGVTTAYELASDGHEVHVFERRASACEETSFANAGVIAPGYVTPWAAPGMPGKVLKSFFQKHTPIRLKLPFNHGEFGWIRQWLQACTPVSYQMNRSQMQRLASYSAERLQLLTKQLQLEYESANGYLVLLRTEQELSQIQPSLAVLKEADFAHAVIGAAAARALEPGLNASTALHAAIHLPNDKVANCRQFALLLKDKAIQMGAQFHFTQTVTELNTHSKGLDLISNKVVSNFDHVVVCAALGSKSLLKPLGVQLPMIPVYGYSISAAMREPMDAPTSGIMDERYKVAISRIGNRIRVAGGAELGGDPTKINTAAIQTLYKVLSDWFPASADTKNQVQIWKGARPMLPSGPPRIGRVSAGSDNNVWLNLGHGSSGWALACGSARLISDKIAGLKPSVDY